MREMTFLKRNSEYWKAFELQLKNKTTQDPDELASHFIRLTDDLSYARTFYKNSPTHQYLNELTTIVHQKIYKNKKEKSNRFFTFFKYEVPLASYKLRKALLYSFLIFIVAMLMGVLSQKEDESFARIILGDEYVNMTLENIKNGDPMGVYKDASPISMFFRIALNNIMVAVSTFIKGIGFSVWGAFSIFYNGLMFGVFQFFFYKYHLLYETSLTIFIHGTLELSAIIIAGGAGLALGNSILFPGTFTRLQSLNYAVRNGLKIIISLFPIFLMAAFLESFVTRHTEMPLWLSLTIIALSLAFIVFYYIIYPRRLYGISKH